MFVNSRLGCRRHLPTVNMMVSSFAAEISDGVIRDVIGRSDDVIGFGGDADRHVVVVAGGGRQSVVDRCDGAALLDARSRRHPRTDAVRQLAGRSERLARDVATHGHQLLHRVAGRR